MTDQNFSYYDLTELYIKRADKDLVNFLMLRSLIKS